MLTTNVPLPMTPDYKGFGEHLLDWDEQGIPYGTQDLIRLAEEYHTPIPGSAAYQKQFASEPTTP